MILKHNELKTRDFIRQKGMIQSIFDCVIDYVEEIETWKGSLILIQYFHKGKKKRYEQFNLRKEVLV